MTESPVTPEELERVRAGAELLYTADEVERALDSMASDITATLGDKNPVILCLMVGAVVTVGKLLPRLDFPLQLEYVHATRYQGNTTGRTVEWLKSPSLAIQNRTVLIVDDILDEGITLSSIIKECNSLRAKEIFTAVLINKNTPKKSLQKADFTGLYVPDRYVFGYGMDYKEYLRNVPGIYAVKEE